MVDPSPKAVPRIDSPAKGAAEGGDVLDAAMDRYARGDDGAFAEIHRHSASRLRGFLVRLCGDGALADDLAQEAFLRVHRARGSFEAGAAALPWIFAIARNVFLDHTRQAYVKRTTTVGDGKLPDREAPAETQGDLALAGNEMLGIVRDTLAALPALQREAFLLLRFEGMSVAEAAEVLGATEGAVKVRAFRAYEALREALGKAGQEVGKR
ncbi:MAG TPA: RNA polymerase sigma factor [Polyangiaceae bacterium]